MNWLCCLCGCIAFHAQLFVGGAAATTDALGERDPPRGQATIGEEGRCPGAATALFRGRRKAVDDLMGGDTVTSCGAAKAGTVGVAACTGRGDRADGARVMWLKGGAGKATALKPRGGDCVPELGPGSCPIPGEPARREPKLEAGELAPVRHPPEQVLALVGERELCLELKMGRDKLHPLACGAPAGSMISDTPLDAVASALMLHRAVNGSRRVPSNCGAPAGSMRSDTPLGAGASALGV